jgi:hypothetical protein
MQIYRSIFYRASLTSGPSSVLVSIRFGTTPAGGPAVRFLAGVNHDGAPRFDLEKHVAEILEGVDAANHEHAGSLQVETVEVVPDDYPSGGQARFLAYNIARAVLRAEV